LSRASRVSSAGVAACCSVLQCSAVSVCSSMLQYFRKHLREWSKCCSTSVSRIARVCSRCCSVLQRVVVCCRVLQCVPVCCSILGGVRGSGPSVAAQSHVAAHLSRASCMLQRVAVCYRVRVLQHVAVCWEASEGVEQVLLRICLLSCVSCVPAAGVAACCSGLPSVAVCREAPEQVMLHI